MTSFADISRDREAALRVIDALLFEDQLTRAEKDKLRDLRTEIGRTALNAIVALPELAAALQGLAQEATDRSGVATDEQAAAAIAGDLSGVLGKVRAVVAAAQDVLDDAAD